MNRTLQYLFQRHLRSISLIRTNPVLEFLDLLTMSMILDEALLAALNIVLIFILSVSTT